MKILLISPDIPFPHVSDRWFAIPQLSLPIIAALTPSHHHVCIAEEPRDKIPRDEQWDVVGITSMTNNIFRAYQLADDFKKRGSVVVMGGIHPSCLPDEALRHADAVVIGEAEGVWREILNDVERRSLKKTYISEKSDPLAIPIPWKPKRRLISAIIPQLVPTMTSRGCPHDCEFCSVNIVHGRVNRRLPIDRILEDVKRYRGQRLFFVDDNIGASRAFALEVFRAITPLKVRWVGEATVKFLLDEELFHAALESGLDGLFVGLESVEPGAFQEMRKLPSTISEVEEAIRRAREAGIVFHASLVFGMDSQSKLVFEHTLDFLERNAVPSISACMLTPYPGTRLFSRLEKENRILHKNWSYYDHNMICFRPLIMEPEELAERYLDFMRRIFSWPSIVRRSRGWMRSMPWVILGGNYLKHMNVPRMKRRYKAYFEWLKRSGESYGRGA